MNKQLIKQEFIAGVTTFLTMSYIVVVNPAILATQGTGMAFSGVMTATVVLSFLATLFMGLYAKLPYAVAPGMGINAFFTYSIVLGQGVPWQTALGMVVWSGVIFLILSILPVREAILKSMPVSIRHAAAVGIGLFLTFIGLKNGGVVTSNPATFVTFSPVGIDHGLIAIGLVVSGYLLKKKSPFALLASILIITALSVFFGKVSLPEQVFSKPDFTSVLFKQDLVNSFKLALLPAILSLMFTDLFDSISTFMGLSHASGLIEKNGEPKNVKQGLIVDALATFFAGFLGTSSGTAYIESAAGIKAGGKTGLTAVFAAICFLPFLFVGPLAQMVPGVATAPVLIIVGFLMFQQVKEISLNNIEDALPAFLTLILIPLTFSITQGLLWGLISHVILYIIVGRARELSKGLYFVAALCLVLLFVQQH